MKVCFITGEYPPMQGGIADHTRQLATALHQQGVEVSVLTSATASAGPKVGQGQHPSSQAGDPFPVYASVEKWNFRSWPQILGHLSSTQPDIVHIQYQTIAYAMHPAINLLPLWLRRQRERPGVVATIHELGVPYLFPKAGKLRHKVTTALIRGSDRTIVTNGEDWAGACTLSRAGIPAGRVPADAAFPNIRIVPIGSNIAMNPPEGFERNRWRSQLGIPDGHILLSYFGLLNHSKGVETLLKALLGMARDGVPAKLLMIGAEAGNSDPTNIVYRRQIVRSVQDLGLVEHVVWTGHATPRDVSGHLLSSDICVLPFRDGVSFRRTSLLTALSHGIPTISTRGAGAAQTHTAGSSANQLMDGVHVLLVDIDDPAGLEQTIRSLIERDDLRLRLGDEGRKFAESFSWPTIARQTLSIYDEILPR